MFAKVALLVGGVIIQETVTLNALLFLTHHGMYPPLLIHFSFFTATIIDMIIGFRIGKYLHKRTHATKLATYIQKLSNRFSLKTNAHRRRFVLFFLSSFSFLYLIACIAGYLDMPFWESSLFLFLGNILYYVLMWLIVLGISSIIKNIYLAYGIIIALGLIIIFISKKLKITRG